MTSGVVYYGQNMRVFWRYLERVAGVLPYLFVFIASLYIPSDPDLGWHLKYGEYFFRYGQILRNNIFSTMMPDFQWANGQWGTDALTYIFFRFGGFLGIALAAAAIVALTFYFFARAARFQLVEKTLLFPLFVYLESPMNSVSFRGQQISLMLTGIMCLILSRYKPSSKVLFWLPVLYLFWANIHEQFLMGLVVLGAWIGITVIRNFFVFKEDSKKVYREAGYLIFVFLLTFFATFINPFFAGIHIGAFTHFGNPYLKDVAEYLPFAFLSRFWWTQVVVGVLVVFSIIFLYFTGGFLKSLPIMGAAFLLLGFSFDVRRYAWMAYYLIFPILLPLATFLTPDKKRNKLYFSLALSVISLSLIVLIRWPLSNYMFLTWDKYCQNSNVSCSPASAEYIRNHKLTHNLLSLYGWGGWLIWNYSDIRPSIDGRMHVWEKGGYSAFGEYYKYEQNLADVDKSKYSVVYMPPGKPIYKRLERLVAEGKWNKVYEDRLAGIFVRK